MYFELNLPLPTSDASAVPSLSKKQKQKQKQAQLSGEASTSLNPTFSAAEKQELEERIDLLVHREWSLQYKEAVGSKLGGNSWICSYSAQPRRSIQI